MSLSKKPNLFLHHDLSEKTFSVTHCHHGDEIIMFSMVRNCQRRQKNFVPRQFLPETIPVQRLAASMATVVSLPARSHDPVCIIWSTYGSPSISRGHNSCISLTLLIIAVDGMSHLLAWSTSPIGQPVKPPWKHTGRYLTIHRPSPPVPDWLTWYHHLGQLFSSLIEPAVH